MATETKGCHRCGRNLPITSFYIDRSKKDGLNPNCKECRDLYARENYNENIEVLRVKKKEQMRKSRLKSKDPDYGKNYYRENHEKRLKKSIDYYHSHKEEISERRKTARREKKLKSMMVLGGAVCVICGYDDIRSLSIDHINNDGAQERANGEIGHSIHTKILSMEEGEAVKVYQVLCRNCNWIKHTEHAEYETDYA